jgi:hypothetical protein
MESNNGRTYIRTVIAALISVLLIIAVIILVNLVVDLVRPKFPRHVDRTNSLLSDEKVKKLNSEGMRQQIISFENPHLIDTLNLIYLIPVEVKTLDKTERSDSEITSVRGERVAYERIAQSSIDGLFSNLIVYDYRNKTAWKICDTRLIGMNLKVRTFSDDILLPFIGTDTDSNNDGNIDYRDSKALFVYSLKEKKLRRFGIEKSSVESFEFVAKQKDILVSWKNDRNGDNKFDPETEPSFITRYNDDSKTMNPVIDSKLEKELQKIVEK